jgi:hypothetical protein
MPGSCGGGNLVKGGCEMARRLRRCLGVKGKVEENTLLEYNLKAEAKMEILDKKNRLKEMHIVMDGLVY